jgi:RNA polymerase sigma-70 factor (ECF subfamily)
MAEVAEDFALLVGRVRLGDVEALAELTRRYESEVRLAARVLLGRALRSHLDSADLVQSVHHTLLLGIRHNKFELSSPQQLLGLAVTMVRRKVARHWRRLQRQQTFDPQEGETRGPSDLLTCLSSGEADPAEQAQYHDAVEHVCRHLDEKDRRLVELRLQGFSTAEAARQLGEDADILRVRLSRLRRRLRDGHVLQEWL